MIMTYSQYVKSCELVTGFKNNIKSLELFKKDNLEPDIVLLIDKEIEALNELIKELEKSITVYKIGYKVELN